MKPFFARWSHVGTTYHDAWIIHDKGLGDLYKLKSVSALLFVTAQLDFYYLSLNPIFN